MSITQRKNVWIVLLGLTGIFSLGRQAWSEELNQSTQQPTDLPKVTGVDGMRVADWKGQGIVVTALAGDGPTLLPADAFSAKIRLGWTDEGIVAQFDVIDTTPTEVEALTHLYQGDSVDLQLMATDVASGMAQVVASPGRTEKHREVRVNAFDYRTSSIKASAGLIQPKSASRLTERGYVIDLLAPWSSLNLKARPGTTVGLRASVTDADGKAQRSQRWIDRQGKAEWMSLSQVRLVDGAPAAGPSPIAMWAGYDDFTSTYVNVLAEPQLAGRALTILDDGKVVGEGKLTRDGDRAIASLRLPLPPTGATYTALQARIDGQLMATYPMPDLREERRKAFVAADQSVTRWERVEDWQKPRFAKTVLTVGAAFPACEYPEPARIDALVGSYIIETSYFDENFNRVTRPTRPGRYGAHAHVIAADGQSFAVYETLYCADDKSVVTPPTTQPNAAALLAAKASNPTATEFDATKANHDWWHAMRKQLGTATRYDYYVRLPKGYDDDPTRRWPVIVYLHGSGGGDNPRDAVVGGPQKAAAEKANFPFITVSLRSPRGWHPPAVHDVLDAIEATCRTDPTRYYLTGFSMGGIGTWAVALDRPERFAAIAPVGGRSGDPSQAARLKVLAAWVINGSADNTTTSADALKAVEALRAVGAEVKWTDIDGANHVESLVIAYGWDELYQWFLQHQRPE